MPIRLARTKNMWQGWSGGLTLMLMIICSPVVALADLIVDYGETYMMSADITNNNVTVGQNSTGTLLQGGLAPPTVTSASPATPVLFRVAETILSSAIYFWE